ncbi:metallophosphoesterase [Massilia sp. TS11]|uniref:metallophosphoesterase family protein n=1 Tax=Massilia sp. TS11 TaxID=2908003 RepID=UPI001EDAD41B|nr:metallophosphoesterase [Massilia sp. TS11]MCG2586385.1 metallophosphoesterase [Massilia sp. TS11]
MRLPVLLAVLLGGCASLPAPPSGDYRYVVLGEQGAATVRVLTAAASCPLIEVDGRSVPMQLRAAPAVLPARPSVMPDSPPAAFPLRTCEAPLPLGARQASVGGQALPLPAAQPTRLVVLGDSGCRLSSKDAAWQACNDAQEFPFATVAASIARWKPDLIIHVGDYLYRESACPPGQAGCAGSPWGYGWDSWEADFFAPARPLLAAAPLVAARGNHELCTRGGQGYWRLLDPRPLLPGRDCVDPAQDQRGNHGAPYAVPLGGGAQLVVLDTAANVSKGYAEGDWRPAAIAEDIGTLEALSEQAEHTLAVLHHPPLSVGGETKHGKVSYFNGDRGMQQALARWSPALLPPRVQALLSGHTHMWQQASYATPHPSQFVVGFAGTQEDIVPLPDPLPPGLEPGAGARFAEFAAWVGGFGFMTMERRGPDRWDITVMDRHGQPVNHCQLSGRQSHCAHARGP